MPDPTPPNLDAPADADDLFARFGQLDSVEAFVSAAHGLPDDLKATLHAEVETARAALSDEIAAAIQAHAAAGQVVPDFVESSDGHLYTIDTATGKPRLDAVVIVHAADIPLPKPPAPPVTLPGDGTSPAA